MSWYDNKSDFWNLIGDPGGYVSGVNKEGFGGVKKMLFGDPEAIKKAYDQAMSDAKAGGQNITNFLTNRQGAAQQYYQPLQHLFDSAYGSEGIKGPQTPPAGGSPILSSMYRP